MANRYVHHTVENSSMSVIKNSVLCLEKYIPVFFFFLNSVPLGFCLLPQILFSYPGLKLRY